MLRKTVALLLLVAATYASAATRTRAVGVGSRPEADASGATAGGIVESVNGNLVTLANGLVTIDVTGAKIVVDRGRDATAASIVPGMLLFAALKSNHAAPGAPLPAAMVNLTSIPDATLFGPIESVNAVNGTFILLGRTIHVTDETSFGGFYDRGDESFGVDDLEADDLAQVLVVARGGELTATSVLVLAPPPPPVEAMRGTVQTIGADSWTIERDRGDVVTVLVSPETRIAGNPKVGDTVEVILTKNEAGALVALSIIKYERPDPPPVPNVIHIKGKVQSIEGSTWVVTREENTWTFTTTERTKIQPGIVVGDTVDVIAEVKDDRSLVAVVILELP